MVRSAVTRRFNNRWEGKELDLLSDYLYHITAAPACGEFAMNSILMPVFAKESAAREGRRVGTGVYAREPLEKVMHDQLNVPTLVIFGDSDWLSYPGVRDTVRSLRQSGKDVHLEIIPNAGHHLYMDNVDHFHSVLRQWKEKRM